MFTVAAFLLPDLFVFHFSPLTIPTSSATMQARLALLFITLMAFALFAAASPVPDAALAKKSLKQYNARRGVQAKKRDDQHYGPSK